MHDCMDSENLHRRLKKIIGQIQAIDRMIDEDIPCEGISKITKEDLAFAKLAGCRLAHVPSLGGAVPLHDGDMRTTNADVYVAGDISGVEEASTAMDEGRLAGASAARDLGYLDEAGFSVRKAEIVRRMNALRSGEFGERRREAKKKLLDLFEKAEGGETP